MPCPGILRRRAAVALLGALTMLVTVQPLTAAAATGDISGVHLTKIRHTSFTVALHSLGQGWKYHLYTSTTKSKVYTSNISQAQHAPVASKPLMTTPTLAYSTSVYWYRIQATNGSRRRTSPIYSVGLRPSAPTSLKVTSNAGRLPFLTWSSGSVTGFIVQTATNAGFDSGVHKYKTLGNGHHFTPYLVSKNSTVFYRVRAVNNGTASAFSTPVSALVKASRQSVKVMTYNILSTKRDGQPDTPGGDPISPWSDRKLEAVKLINGASPDLISLQEASAWVGSPQGYGGTRQVDSLVSALGGSYGLARTEVPPTEHGYFRTGDYILYNKSTFRTVGTGDHFRIGTYAGDKWEAVQVLENVTTGARLLFVATHTSEGSGSAADSARQQEAKTLISKANTYNSSHGDLPVVYAGDFNSHAGVNHSFDGPGIVMNKAGNPDAFDVAQSRTAAAYNSANRYLRRPPHTGDDIDHIYVPSGGGVSSWKIVIHVVSGKFVGVIPSDHNPVQATVWVGY